MRSAALVVLLLIGLAAALALGGRSLPLVRNSLVYARASEHVLEHGGDPRPVVADSALSYDKPILYSWFSAPFVRWLGNHDGLRLTSFLGGIAYLLSLLAFARAFRPRLPEDRGALFLWLCAAGPCVVYQFWSAHPDGWFAALVISSWTIVHRIVEEPERRTIRRVLLLGVVIHLAVLLKNYGLILLVSCPLYLLCHVRRFRADSERFVRLVSASTIVFAVLGALAFLAWKELYPLSRLEGEGGGFRQYENGDLARNAPRAGLQLGLATALQFHLALLFALHRRAWRLDFILPAFCFGGVYVAGLLPFPTTFYNMRYFLPVFPLVGWMLVRGAAGCSVALRSGLVGAYTAIACALIALFNVEPLYRAVKPALPDLRVDWVGQPLSLLDNLRMELHCEARDELDHVNRVVPSGAVLYLLNFAYYTDAQHGVYERAGFLRGDLAIRYASSRGFAPPEREFYVWCYRRRAPGLDRLGQVTDLGGEVYRIER